jgi:hypothetical protein
MARTRSDGLPDHEKSTLLLPPKCFAASVRREMTNMYDTNVNDVK